jgi:hypothetical protein
MAIGSISFLQYPVSNTGKRPVITNWTPIVPYSVKQTDISGLFYFKFILEIRITDASGTLLAKLKQKKNPSTTGTTDVNAIFDLKDIVNTQLKTQVADYNSSTGSIHLLGANVATKPFSLNTSQILQIYVKAYQEYSDSATTSPTENAGVNVTDTLFYIPASLDLNRERSTTNLQGTGIEQYKLKDISKKLLSDIEESYSDVVGSSVRHNILRSTDYHTVGFLNGQTDLDSLGWYWQLKYYDAANAQIGSTQELINDNSNGGAKPNTSGGEVSLDTERLIYFGCGPANLEAQSVVTAARPSNFTDWAYYLIQAFDNSIASGSDTIKSAKYYFVRNDDNCKGYDIRRLAWINSKGCWDYFNFTKKSTQTLKVERDNYQTMIGDFSRTQYSYNNFEGGKKVSRTTASLSETLNTDWITEDEAVLLENLMKATKVNIVENDYTTYTVPVLIKDSSFVKKTSVNDRLKIRYTIQIEYANPVNTNS